MKKIIRDVDQERGIVQVTCVDERWYAKPVGSKETGLPEYKFVPSVTFIAGSYPKGIGYAKWLAEHGWDEAETIKKEAGTKGSKVHQAIESILNGQEVRIDSSFMNWETEKDEELTVDEVECIMSFIKWREETEKTYDIETLVIDGSARSVLFSDVHNYAGTVDWVVKMTHKETKEARYFLIDFKTSQSVFPSHEIQVSAYRETVINGENPVEGLPEDAELEIAILQLGYRKNKAGYKFTEIEPQFDLFLATRTIWKNEHGTEKPSQKDYPLVLSPASEITIAEVLQDLGIEE